jgi:hypothetical protein
VNSILPAINTVIAKCLAIYNNKMSAFRNCMASLLIEGGTTEQCMDQLAAFYDCTSRTARNRKQLEFAKEFDVDIKEWKARGQPYTLAFDNVDKRIKSRHSTVEKKAKLSHMIISLAFRDRVPFTPGRRITPLDKLNKV